MGDHDEQDALPIDQSRLSELRPSSNTPGRASEILEHSREYPGQDVTPYLQEDSDFEESSDEEPLSAAASTGSSNDANVAVKYHESGSQDDSAGRPRFQGSAAKYKRLVRHEKLLLEGIEAAENNDLSAHLLEIHLIKLDNYKKVNFSSKADPTDGQTPQEDGVAANREDDVVEHLDGKDKWKLPDKWQPDQTWTAWPLPAEHVPVADERWTRTIGNVLDDELTVKRREEEKPSQELEDLILAEMTRHARHGFEAWQTKMEELRNATPQAQRFDFGMDGVVESIEADDDDQLDIGHDEASKRAIVGNRKQVAPVRGSNNFDNSRDVSPVLPSDDERALRLLQPSIRKILNDLDDLLTGLGHSRQNHRASTHSESSSDSGKESSDSDTGSDDSNSRSRKRRRSVSVDNEDARPSRKSSHLIRSPTPGPGPASTAEPGLRDWSEVLGNALLTGWDTGVVERAAARCSELFGEDMYIQDILEAPASPVHEQSIASSTTSHSSVDKGIVYSLVEASVGWICPMEDCIRHIRPFGKKSTCTRHVKGIHNVVADYEVVFCFYQQESDLRCQLSACRHEESFQTQDALDEHVKTVHPLVKLVTIPARTLGSPTEQHPTALARSGSSATPGRRQSSGTPAQGMSRSQSLSSVSSSAHTSSGSEDSMFGGVHVDGYLRPISFQRGWKSGDISRGPSMSRDDGSSSDLFSSSLESQDSLSENGIQATHHEESGSSSPSESLNEVDNESVSKSSSEISTENPDSDAAMDDV